MSSAIRPIRRSTIRSRVRASTRPEHPVVERGDHPAGQDPEVPRVRVGVEEAEPEDLAEEDHRPPAGDVDRVDPERPEPCQVIDRNPADQLHRQDPRGRVLAVRLGDVGVPLAGKLAAAPLHRPEFDRQVELALEGPLELTDQPHRAILGERSGRRRLGELGEVLEDVEVGLDRPLDPGGGGPSARSPGRPGGSSGGPARSTPRRSARRRPGKDLVERPAVLFEEDRLDLGERDRLDLVAEQRQFGDVGFGRRSGRVLSTWPSLTKVGPRSSQMRRSRSGRACGGTSSPSVARSIGPTTFSRWRAWTTSR